MGTCKDCKWWEQWVPDNTGECSNTNLVKAGDDEGFESMPEEGQLMARSEGSLIIMTTATFGCIHFDKKE